MKKYSVFLLVLALLLSLSACIASTPPASESITSSPTSEAGITFPLAEPVTFSMFTIVNSNVELSEVLSFKKLAEMTNVHWKIQSALPAQIAETRSLLLASNQYPDVFYRSGLDDNTVSKYGTQGTFIPLNDLVSKYAPNFTTELDSRPSARDMITMGDGNIYALPQLVRDGAAWVNFFVNKPWLTELGLEVPTNLEEFYDTLVAFKTKDPNNSGSIDDEIPYTSTADLLFYFLPNFGMQIDPNSGYTMAMIDGEYEYLYSNERYKEFLTYLAMLYKEGLLDKNTFIQTNDQLTALGSSGDTIGFFSNLASFLTVGRDKDADFVRVPVFADHVLPYTPGIGSDALAITDKCQSPETVISWVDYLYSQEGGALVFMGIEDETYKMNSDGSWEWILGDYPDISTLRAATCMQGGALDPSIQPDLWFENKSDTNEYKFNHDVPTEREINQTMTPVLKYSEEEQATIATITADLTPYINQYRAQVITGEIDLESSWQEYLDTLKKMELDKMIDIIMKAHNKAK